MSKIEKTEPVVGSPMPDYSIEGLGKGGEVAAIAVGTLAVLAISLGLGKVFSKKN
ncbi:Additional substrate-specific component NikN of nickel ECF transporter [Methanosarcina barkeri str. Wiesmoor]|nr:Additional substrate-specific component NikN of nickel ECF transporter [Methanosarcina barkeri str. Wiesmoor]